MSIHLPNTTPVPNEIINGWAKKLKGSELKVLLIVTRKTLGWIIDPKTGMRKEEDWITSKQMMTLTGLTSRSLSDAIDTLVNDYELIQVRTSEGKLLESKKDRQEHGRTRKKSFYRLNLSTLTETSHFFKKERSTSLKSKVVTSLKSKDNKINIITKSNITKDICRDIYDHYCKSFNKNPNQYRLLKERREKINTRLKMWKPEDIKKAITNASLDRFYSGENDRGWVADLNYICRNDEIMERLINLKPQMGKKRFDAQDDNLKQKYAKYSK